jgi:hypothetical protein
VCFAAFERAGGRRYCCFFCCWTLSQATAAVAVAKISRLAGGLAQVQEPDAAAVKGVAVFHKLAARGTAPKENLAGA